MAQDVFENTRVAMPLGGDSLEVSSIGGTGGAININSGGALNIATGGILQDNGVNRPASITFAAAAGAANITNVTVTVKDANGVAIAAPINLDLWLSDAATGAGLTAVTASGTVVAGASGVDIGDYTAKKAKRVQTTTGGVYILQITDTGKTGFFVCAQLPSSSRPAISAQLVTGNYG